MTKIQVLVGSVALSAAFLVPAVAHAGPCDSVNKYTKEVWGELNEVADKACKEGSGCKDAQSRVQKLYAEVDKVVKWWNSMTKGTWAQLGPRNFSFGQKNKGTLVAPGDRTWISTLPAKNDWVSVALTKSDGAGDATAYVCVADEKGKLELATSFDVDKNGTVKRKISGVAGKVVVVRLDGKGGVGKKLEYQLEVQ